MAHFSLVVAITSLVFLLYGLHCLTADSMELEFNRYGLKKLRLLTGFLQILGGIGLLLGLKIQILLELSSLGLALMMLAAFMVRLKINDRLLQMLPALFLMFINLYILFY